MKKILFCCSIVLFSFETYSQFSPVIEIPFVFTNPCSSSATNPTWNSGAYKIYNQCTDVRVGIGTTNPTHSLQVLYDARFGQAKVDYNQGIGDEPNSFSKLYIRNPNQNASIEINHTGNHKPYQKFLDFKYTEPTTEILKAYNSQTGSISYLFEASGKMTVSNGVQKIFQLNTNGLLRVRNVRVDTETWPDYVFKSDYNLMSLDEMEQFIHENGHLPNIPSESEIMREGVDVANMNVKLVEKIEELMLYTIEQQKEIDQLKKELVKFKRNKK